MKVYLSKLGREGLSEENGPQPIIIIDSAIDLDHIGDIMETPRASYDQSNPYPAAVK